MEKDLFSSSLFSLKWRLEIPNLKVATQAAALENPNYLLDFTDQIQIFR